MLIIKEILTVKEKKNPTKSKEKEEKQNVYLDMILDILVFEVWVKYRAESSMWSYEVDITTLLTHLKLGF